MGWNSWDCYGTTVTEDEVLANARFIRDRLLPSGWDTVVVDAAWFDPTARSHGYNEDAPFTLDQWGYQLPSPNRFPSAENGEGFRPLADRIHDLGLRFGLHVMRGIPRLAAERALPIPGSDSTTSDIADRNDTCEWNPDNFGLRLDLPASQQWVDGQVRQFADWGVDYLKVDDMLDPYDTRHIDSYAAAISRSGRNMALSLSPGVDLPGTVLGHVSGAADLWRISGDIWDQWSDVLPQFDRLAMWAPTQGEGGWADADMLPLGRIGIRAERGDDRLSRLTDAEQRSLFTLWCIARSPLMMGGDLPTSPRSTIEMLVHPGLMEVHRDARSPRQVLRTEDLAVWTATTAETGTWWTAIFHLGDQQAVRHLPPAALVDPRTTRFRVVDAWSGRELDDPFSVAIEPHGCRLLRFDPA